jgi:hypothetical protein
MSRHAANGSHAGVDGGSGHSRVIVKHDVTSGLARFPRRFCGYSIYQKIMSLSRPVIASECASCRAG